MSEKTYSVDKKKLSKYLCSYGTERNESEYFGMLGYSIESGYKHLESVSRYEIDNFWRVPFRETSRLNTANKVIKRFFKEQS